MHKTHQEKVFVLSYFDLRIQSIILILMLNVVDLHEQIYDHVLILQINLWLYPYNTLHILLHPGWKRNDIYLTTVSLVVFH